MRNRTSPPDNPGTILLVGMEPEQQRVLQQAFDRRGWGYVAPKSPFDAGYALIECTAERTGIIMDIDQLGMNTCLRIAEATGHHRLHYKTLLIGLHRPEAGTKIERTAFDMVYNLPLDADLCAIHTTNMRPDNMFEIGEFQSS